MTKSAQLIFLYIVILVSLVFLGIVISPFLTTLILAAILVTGTFPIYEWVLRKVRNRKSLAAALMSLSIGVIFSILFLVFVLMLSDEAVSAFKGFNEWISTSKININEMIGKASRYIGIPKVDVISYLTQGIQTLSTALVSQSTNILTSLFWMIVNFFLLVFTMYFFYKDGTYLMSSFAKVIPLPKQYEKEIFEKFRSVSLAMLYGVFLTAIAQGILGGIGLAVAGVENSIFWGTVMGLLGILPVGGTALVWLPAGILLLTGGHYFAGIGLLIWGGLVVAFIDNLIKPLIIMKQTKTYPLATFLVVIGGLIIFGLKGAIISPMVLAALMTFIHIYQLEKTAG